MRTIVNADDLGLSDVVNDAIFHMMSLDRITSATIMANAPATDAAIRSLPRYPTKSFGVHLNLTQFAPLSSAPGLRPLLDESGMFRDVIRSVPWSASLLRAVATELAAQIQSLIARGVRISHIDSHHHVHTIPVMYPVVKYLQARFGIRRVRISWNYYANGKWPGPVLLRKKRLFNAALAGIRTRRTDGFADLFAFLDNARQGPLPCRSFEIMVHPGADEREDQKVLSRWEEEVPFPIEFMSYRDL
jgi:predicted glycoside hydrolase/deacetylase ChbG (UPF0249 family)